MKEYIRKLINKKKSNICISLDFTNKNDIIKKLNLLKENIIMVKIHCDIIDNFDKQFIINLTTICKKNDILIFEDRKFADIGYIFNKQFTGGTHKIQSWCNLITVHSLVGEGVIKEFNKTKNKDQGILLIAQMSNKNNLFNDEYVKKTLKIAEKNNTDILGFICQTKISNNFLHFIPGVNRHVKKDNSDQKYILPEIAIKNGADVVIIGRGITNQKDILEECKIYQKICWDLYKLRISQK